MKDFKQTTKMKAQGSHYCGGGKVKKYADGGDVETQTAQGQNKNIGDDVRARAMAAMAKREQDIGGGGDTAPTPVKKAAPKKAAPKLYQPDYSPDDEDRLGLSDDIKPVKKVAPKFSAAKSIGASEPTAVPDYAKSSMGYKRGGKVKRGAKK
jgi:hypothetical protein